MAVQVITIKEYKRFAAIQLIEHWFMVASFTVLAVTGIPQKFTGNGWAEALIAVMGGIETVRFAHHLSAIVMLLESIYHVIVVAYKIIVLRVRWSMFPQLQDAQDAVQAIKYNIGLTRQAPRCGRYNFGEKFEYWALVWGTLIMALTGFMLWNPIIASRIFSGDLIPTAKAAHGGEAILAVLAVVTWHFYNVHIKAFNKAMFTSRMSAHEMEEEHADEMERMDRGEHELLPPAETIRARRSLFLPVSILLSIALLYGVYLFISAETTAVSTVPPPVSRNQVFVPRPPTATPTRLPTATPAIKPAGTPAAPGATPAGSAAKLLPASHAGRNICQACHVSGVGGAPKNPADHAGRLDASCKDCHKGP
ncbi:MAG: cytochrome b/b6 domain-containing protein [Chloroflexi bacterium]|nr:cytochrome b/b6 domain-containing protein [Chloroflexota bacterium]